MSDQNFTVENDWQAVYIACSRSVFLTKIPQDLRNIWSGEREYILSQLPEYIKDSGITEDAMVKGAKKAAFHLLMMKEQPLTDKNYNDR